MLTACFVVIMDFCGVIDYCFDYCLLWLLGGYCLDVYCVNVVYCLLVVVGFRFGGVVRIFFGVVFCCLWFCLIVSVGFMLKFVIWLVFSILFVW